MATKNGRHPQIEMIAVASLSDQPFAFDEKAVMAAVNAPDVQDIENRNYLYITSWLCHADVPNKNKDMFVGEDLRACIQEGQISPIKPLVVDINHQTIPACGVTVDAIYAYDNNAQSNGLLVRSVIFAWGPGPYQENAKRIVEAAQRGELRFSMMAFPEYVKCVECGGIYDDPDNYCEHLSTMNAVERSVRIARHPEFVCNSIITSQFNPADQYALPESVSAIKVYQESDEPTHLNAHGKESVHDQEIVKELLDESIDAGCDKKKKKHKSEESQQIDDSNDVQGGQTMEEIKILEAKVTELETKLESMQASLDSANAKAVEAETLKNQIDAEKSAAADIQAKLDEAIAAKDALEAKVADFEKSKIEAEKQAHEDKVEARVNEILAFVVDATDDEKKVIRIQADTLSDEDFNCVKEMTKKRFVKADVEIEASDALGNLITTAPAGTGKSLIPNITRVLDANK